MNKPRASGAFVLGRLSGKDIINTFVKRKDKTMIMVSHYQEELPSCIDNHIMLQKARSEKLEVLSVASLSESAPSGRARSSFSASL